MFEGIDFFGEGGFLGCESIMTTLIQDVGGIFELA